MKPDPQTWQTNQSLGPEARQRWPQALAKIDRVLVQLGDCPKACRHVVAALPSPPPKQQDTGYGQLAQVCAIHVSNGVACHACYDEHVDAATDVHTWEQDRTRFAQPPDPPQRPFGRMRWSDQAVMAGPRESRRPTTKERA
jgi:hypothetical protein